MSLKYNLIMAVLTISKLDGGNSNDYDGHSFVLMEHC